MSLPFCPTIFPSEVVIERTSVFPFFANETVIFPVLTSISLPDDLTVSLPPGETAEEVDAFKMYSAGALSEAEIECPVHFKELSGQRAVSQD